jgi:hypothetical protein
MGASADAAQAREARRGRRFPSDPLQFKEVGVRHAGCLASRRWLSPQSLRPGAAPHAPRSIAPPIDSGNGHPDGPEMGTNMGEAFQRARSTPTRRARAQQGCPQVRRMVRSNLDGPAGHSSECAGCHHLILGQASFTTDQCLRSVLSPQGQPSEGQGERGAGPREGWRAGARGVEVRGRRHRFLLPGLARSAQAAPPFGCGSRRRCR